jgi:hypothetical protein
MGFYRGPKIVTDGLVLSLDAASPRSYSGSGTVIYDTSGNNNNFDIIGGPTHSNGEFSFTESTYFQRTSAVTNNTECTVVVFYKTTDSQELWLRGQTGSYYIAASSGNNYYNENSGSPSYYVDTIQRSNPTPYRDNNYHMWEAKSVNFSAWTYMAWWGYGSSWNMNGTVSKILVYDRNLTSDESVQNYNALRNRYGIQ